MQMNYFAYGLQITSNISLPLLLLDDYLDTCKATAVPDISITIHKESTKHVDPHNGKGAHWSITRDSSELIIKSVATFRIESGSTIDVYPAFPIDEKMIRLLLINSVLAILLFQRKILVMHGSCVELGDVAVAFMGNSGAGKSLMAGTLCASGHGLITDDISAINMKDDTVQVLPGYPMIKMIARDSNMLGFDDRQNILLHEHHDKLGYRVKDSFTLKQSLPLRYIFILRIGKHRFIEKLSGRQAFIHLIGNSAPQIWRIAPDDLHFSHLEKLCEKVVICEFTREENAEALPEHAEIIKEYCRSHAADLAA